MEGKLFLPKILNFNPESDSEELSAKEMLQRSTGCTIAVWSCFELTLFSARLYLVFALTADTLRLSYSCNFEESTLCGYVQEKVSDQVDWLRYEVGETDGSSISSNLPQSDATTGVQGQG